MGLAKDVKKLVRELLRDGWRVEQGRVHYKLHHPQGVVIIMSGTSSDGNVVHRIRKDVERLNRSHAKTS